LITKPEDLKRIKGLIEFEENHKPPIRKEKENLSKNEL